MQITDRDLQRAAVVLAAGYHVEVTKLSCSPRCAAIYADSAETRALVDSYDRKLPLQIPPKTIMSCYGTLIARAKELKAGRVGGV
jgi:hypothetical protein